MSAPKTIYTDGIKNLAGCIFAGMFKTDKSHLEYRLVGECEWTPVKTVVDGFRSTCKDKLVFKLGEYCSGCGNRITIKEAE